MSDLKLCLSVTSIIRVCVLRRIDGAPLKMVRSNSKIISLDGRLPIEKYSNYPAPNTEENAMTTNPASGEPPSR